MKQDDNWAIALQTIISFINDTIITLFSSNPLTWIKRFMAICTTTLCLLVTIPLSFGINFFLLEMVASFSLISLITATTGLIFYMSIKDSIRAVSPNALSTCKRYFNIVWVVGIVQAPLIWAIASLGHVDCGNSCVSSVHATDLATVLFFIIYILLPFCFWFQLRASTPNKPEEKNENL